jgi:hypothetical protein
VLGFEMDLHEGTTAPRRSGPRGGRSGAERTLRSSMSGLQTRALDGLEAII